MYCSESCKKLKSCSCDDPFTLSLSRSDVVDYVMKVYNKAKKVFEDNETLPELLKNPENLTIFDIEKLDGKNCFAVFASLAKNQATKESKRSYSADIVLNIINTNSFEFAIEEDCGADSGYGSGICLFASLFNHSCIPNIERITYDDKQVFFVGRPIKAGEQLFVDYRPKTVIRPFREQRQLYLNKYNFKCDCEDCLNDESHTQKNRKLKGIPGFVPPVRPSGIKNALKLFRQNCSFIDENWKHYPCSEIQSAKEFIYQIAYEIAEENIFK